MVRAALRLSDSHIGRFKRKTAKNTVVNGQCDSIIPWLFVDSGAKLDTQDNWGNTAFMRVLLDKNIFQKKKLIYAFLDYGADLTNLKNKQGKTAWDMIWDLITHKEI